MRLPVAALSTNFYGIVDVILEALAGESPETLSASSSLLIRSCAPIKRRQSTCSRSAGRRKTSVARSHPEDFVGQVPVGAHFANLAKL